MKISADLEARILALPGTTMHRAKPMGEIEPEPAERKEKPLLEPGVWTELTGDYKPRLVIHLPIKTSSEINLRDWKARSRRSGEAWKVVSRTVGPWLDRLAPFARAYHQEKALKVVFTRLGGRRLDPSNLPTAIKGTEDALAFVLGADDGNPKWSARWEQEESDTVGVRVVIEILP